MEWFDARGRPPWRVWLADQRLVIVKQITDSGDTSADAKTRFAREVAGPRLAGRGAGVAVAPAVVGRPGKARRPSHW
ncbi:hypothetical protein ABZZ44_31760 [Streptomyces sp. NPDC006460]|uniref:hypothetical protein n=1 Tax=Streptomyces sp. NPDC006460 TaxID=3154304 RepID=UPI0033A45E47